MKDKTKYIIGCDTANGEDKSVTMIFKKHPDGTLEALNVNKYRSFMDDVRFISERISLRL